MFLSYYIKFLKNNTIVSKEYTNDCTRERPEKRQMIIIRQDKSIFSAYDRGKKVWTLHNHDFLKSRKEIMVSDILFL